MSRNGSELRGHIEAVLAALVVLACGSSGLPQTRGGYIVLDSRAKEAFELTDVDTLTEAPRADIPRPVIQAAGDMAGVYSFDAACTRFFGSRDGYVALLLKKCGPEDHPDDGENLDFFTPDGQRRLRVTSDGKQPGYVALVPERRTNPR